MDWFRWWHGSVTDPKFQLIARKANTNVASIIAIWAALLESASNVTQCDAPKRRGDASGFDCDAHDVLLGLEEGICAKVIDLFKTYNLINNGRIARWESRQPKREDSSTARTRAWRERKAKEKNNSKKIMYNERVTQCDAPDTDTDTDTDTDKKKTKSKDLVKESISLFDKFWEVYPRHENRKKAYDIWIRKKLDSIAEQIIADVINRKEKHAHWQDKQYIPMPTTYLNGERWNDEIQDKSDRNTQTTTKINYEGVIE
jgi:hypothetical protein